MMFHLCEFLRRGQRQAKRSLRRGTRVLMKRIRANPQRVETEMLETVAVKAVRKPPRRRMRRTRRVKTALFQVQTSSPRLARSQRSSAQKRKARKTQVM